MSQNKQIDVNQRTPDNYRDYCFRFYDRECWTCGEPEDPTAEKANIEVHHIRRTSSRKTPADVVPLCSGCHGKIHSDTPRSGDLGLIQCVTWNHNPFRGKATTRVDTEYVDGDLRFVIGDTDE